MRKLAAMLLLAFGLGLGNAQTAPTTKKEVKKEVKQKKETKKVSQPTTAKLKKDGTPDKRYKQNKKLKKDGTPDRRYKENK